jgi:bifunctional aspartokinase / homoserine dehydrogenase 1
VAAVRAKVLKFGGSSLGTPERIRRAADLVLEEKAGRPIVVVSAFQGVTNQLLESAALAAAGDTTYRGAYTRLAKRHRAALTELVPGRGDAATKAAVEQLLSELAEVLQGIFLLRHAPPQALDTVASFGERLSARIIAAYLARRRRAEFVDARELVVTDDQFTRANVLFDATNRATRAYFRRKASRRGRVIHVVTGFIGATANGETTTIGRNGSDYTATILGAALNASVIEIWTDVDGVMSADPTAVPTASVLPQLSYEEAMELSYFGAKVLHASTIAPAVAKNIPVHIRNTLNPSAPGTIVSREPGKWDGVAKGIASVDDTVLLTLRGVGMVGVPGIAQRLFGALAAHGVSVILISQASSEHTICFAVHRSDAVAATRAVREAFRLEQQLGLTALEERDRQTIVAVVGEGMKGTPGVSGKIFAALGRHNINVSAIAQGASERNVSFVIDAAERTRALNVIHHAFFERRKHLALAVVGVGNIGGALLRQLHQQRSYLLRLGFDVRVVAIANSRRAAIAPDGLNLAKWEETLAASRRPMNIERLLARLTEMELTDGALVDCTASDAVVDAYTGFVEAGFHIVTPNKRANVLPWTRYEALMQLLAKRRKHLLTEANVGAGLPVLSTLNDLIASGDAIEQVEGVLSGTLSYLFNSYDGTRPFSELLEEAHALGFTEPDPRDDLSGADVARKLLILARQMGLRLNIEDVPVESLVPRRLRAGRFTPRFFRVLASYDEAIEQRLSRARAKGRVLRYVGSLRNGRAQAGLEELPRDHPLAATKGTDNVIAFTTARYARTPLVVQGPGAGADVTAMGVFSDLLKLLHYLPH